MKYKIEASIERDGQILDCGQAEILGEAYGKTYGTLRAAEEVARHLTRSMADYGIRKGTRYSVREIRS